jgi:uncharacterized repeat protein (TIGR01451 family)
MKWKKLFLTSLSAFFLLQFSNISGQIPNCDGTVPTFNIDFTGITADSAWISPNVMRAGNCCGTTSPNRCINFIITTDTNTVELSLEIWSGGIPPGVLLYQLDCGPLFNFTNPCPVTVPGIHYLTFCKPGNNVNSYRVTARASRISGKVFNDVNSNCIYDSGDVAVQGIPVNHLFNNVVTETRYTDASGNYYFYASPGNNDIEILGAPLPSYGYNVTCPAGGQINIPSLPSVNNNFGVSCLPGFDLYPSLSGIRFRPGLTGYIYPRAHNNYCQPVNGQAKLIFSDTNITYTAASLPPDIISGDTLIWNLTNYSNQNNIPGTVSFTTDTSSILGDSVCIPFLVEPLSGDNNPSNNFLTRCFVITNSSDPNEKQVEPRGIGPGGNVPPNTTFTYTINFQNTGNDTAYHIFVADTLNSNLDKSSFRILSASHPYNVTFLDTNVVKFSFYSIMLVDSNANEPLSHGWISYEIKTRAGLAAGTQITNSAAIYFDFNLPISTNTTLNTIDTPTYVESTITGNKDIFLFPNPASDILTIFNSQLEIKEVEVYDLTGRKIFDAKLPVISPKHVINVSGLNAGIYFIKVKTVVGEKTFKFVKE